MSSSLASIDEVARRQYEQAWRQGKPDSIHRFLPQPDDPRYLPTLEELVLIEIEMSWKAWKSHTQGNGQIAMPDGVEAYLKRFPALNQSDIIHRLIEHECTVRRQSGQNPSEDDYSKRFPDLTIKTHIITGKAVATGHNPLPGFPLQAGAKLGRYHLADEHSRGSFGIVWRADDLALGRSVALKQLKEYLCHRPDYRQRFLAEAKITAQLQHPGIVPIHDVGGEEEGRPYYTMNMVGGETLAEAIEKYHRNEQNQGPHHSVEWQRLLTAYLTVVRTMAFAHAKNILHRDLKPANIILGQYGETLILDWGLAKVIKDEKADDTGDAQQVASTAAEATQPGSVIGTPAYMSPEQAAGKTDVIRAASDVYSLGTILYELLTGKRPLQGDSAEVVQQLIQARPITPPSRLRRGIARPLEAICLKAMAHEPEQRYAHADLLRADLELFLADEPVGAFVEPWRMKVGRWIRRHKALASGGGATLLLILMGGMVSYFLWSASVEKQRQEAYERIVRVKANVAADDEAASLELAASRYSSVVHILTRAVRSLSNKPELVAEHRQMSAKRDRLQRIAEFTRLADLAEEHAAMDRDDLSITSAENALKLVSITDHLNDWWQHLPVDDLSAEQVTQVKEDASRLLLLLGLQRAKLGILTLFRGKEHYNKALQLIPAIQSYHEAYHGGPAQSALILEQFCYKQLGNKDKFKPLTAWSPRGPADHFYLGICHFYLGSLSRAELTTLLPESLAKDLRSLGGLDLVRPAETGLSLLRMASTLEPRRYWTYNWLGWCNVLYQDYEGAAQAFSAAVSLRPHQAFAYTERATALLRRVKQIYGITKLQPLIVLGIPLNANFADWSGFAVSISLRDGKKNELQEQLLQRTIEGLAIGLKYEPYESSMLFLQSTCWNWMQNQQEGLKAFAAGLVYMVPKETMAGETYVDFINLDDGIRRLLLAYQPYVNSLKDSDAWVTLAMGYFRRTQLQYALTCIDHALIHTPGHNRAISIRGHVLLRQNKLEAARIDLEKAQEKLSDDFLVIAGLARLYELSKEYDKSLAQYRRLMELAKVPWQRVEAGLGQARVLVALQREGDARKIIDDVDDYAPRTAAAAAKKLKITPADSQ